MEIQGSTESLRALPQARAEQLRTALTDMGYGPEETALKLKGLKIDHGETSDVRILSWADTDLLLMLKGENGQVVSALLTSKRPSDRGSMQAFQRILFAQLKSRSAMEFPPRAARGVADQPAPDARGGAENEFPMRVFNLTVSDASRFPVKALASLTTALDDLAIADDVVLRFDKSRKGDGEDIGVVLVPGSARKQSIELTLQDHAFGFKAYCVLTVKHGKDAKDGHWLYENLQNALAHTPMSNPEANTNGDASISAGGDSAMPMTNYRPQGRAGDCALPRAVSPTAAKATGTHPINGSGKVPAQGFTRSTHNIARFLALLRAACPDGVATKQQALAALCALAEPKAGARHPSQGLALIVAHIARAGWLIQTDDSEKTYRILPEGEEPTPLMNARGRKQRGTPELPEDHPARMRIDRLAGVLANDAKRRALIDSKRQEAAKLQKESAELAEKAQALRTEASALESSLLTDEQLGEIDTFLNRVSNSDPDAQPNPLNRA